MSHGSIHCFGHFPSFFVCLPEATPWQERSDEDRPLDFQAPASLQGREQLSGKGHWMLDDGCHFLPKTDEKCPVWWCLMLPPEIPILYLWGSLKSYVFLWWFHSLRVLVSCFLDLPQLPMIILPGASGWRHFSDVWRQCFFVFSDLSLELL